MAYWSSYFDEFNKTDNGLSLRGALYQEDRTRLIISLDGFLETKNSSMFAEVVEKVLKLSPELKTVAFDLHKLTYMSSTGIGVFTEFLTIVKQHGADLFLCNFAEKIRTVIETLGFSKFFNYVDAVEEAFEMAKIGEVEFPVVFRCPSCSKPLKIGKPGRFRCPSCRQKIDVDAGGKPQRVTG